ncbi:hypothetical protein OSH10_04945 [Kaistia defluvii]|uniref:hypothetical protein n=1 Tax=Kaistia defluvii TaxID=410841 RepID=UPI002256CDBE|nr:hypothetical protein [Kaistia defluvii]MCX5517773.1 hypothetical protein [Kaistia defluvii]
MSTALSSKANSTSAVPRTPVAERARKKAEELAGLVYEAERILQGDMYAVYSRDVATALVAHLDAAETVAASVLNQLRTGEAKATTAEISQRLALVIGSNPSAGKGDAAVYGRMLAERVGAQEPTTGALEAACLRIMDTQTFLPSIAEVLTALKAEEALQARWIASLSRLSEARQGLLDLLAVEERRTAEKRASVKRAMRWHLERGKDFPPRTASEHDIMAEVQAEMASDGVAAGSVPFVEGETWWQSATAGT